MQITLIINGQKIVLNCHPGTLFLDFIQAVQRACKEYSLPIPAQYLCTGRHFSYTTEDLSRSLQALGFQEGAPLFTANMVGSGSYDYSQDLSLRYPVETILSALETDMAQFCDDTLQANALLTLYYQHQLLAPADIEKLRQAIQDMHGSKDGITENNPAYLIYQILPMMASAMQIAPTVAEEKGLKKSALDTAASNLITYALSWNIHCIVDSQDIVIPCAKNDTLCSLIKRLHSICQQRHIAPDKLPVHYFHNFNSYNTADLESPLTVLGLKEGDVLQTYNTVFLPECDLSLQKIQNRQEGFKEAKESKLQQKASLDALFPSQKTLQTLTELERNELVKELKKPVPNIAVIQTIISDAQLLNLKDLSIEDTDVQALATALKGNTTLIELDLRLNRIGSTGAQALAEALKTNTTLVKLSLSQNRIGAIGAQAFAEALKTNTTLVKLSLSNNQIKDTGAQALAATLKTNTTLAVIYLQRGDIEVMGAQALAEALKINTTLVTLDLEQNHVGDTGAQAFAETLKTNTTLVELNLSNNQIRDTGAQALAEVLKINTTLTVIYLQINYIEDTGAQAFAEALKINTTLVKLSLWGNEIGATGIQALEEALKTNTTLLELRLVFFSNDSDKHAFKIVLAQNRRHQRYQQIYQNSLSTPILEEIRHLPPVLLASIIPYITPIKDNIQNFSLVEAEEEAKKIAEIEIIHKDMQRLSQLFERVKRVDGRSVSDMQEDLSLREKLHVRDVLMQIFAWCGLKAVADINGEGQLIINDLSQIQFQILAQDIKKFSQRKRPNKDLNRVLEEFLKKQSFTETNLFSSNDKASSTTSHFLGSSSNANSSSSIHSPRFFRSGEIINRSSTPTLVSNETRDNADNETNNEYVRLLETRSRTGESDDLKNRRNVNFSEESEEDDYLKDCGCCLVM